MPFFKLLKKTDHFTWTPEAQEAFEDFKKYLTSPPVLASPSPNELLLLYVSATEQVVVEREEDRHTQLVQRPVYFVSEVSVVTSYPLGDIIHNKEVQGPIAKWALEMMIYDITFKPRTAIKSQALADFVAEWTDVQLETAPEELPHWTMYFDGSLRMSRAGAGVVLISPNSKKFKCVLQIHFPASHNVAEYEALLHGLRLAISLRIRWLLVRGDSQLVVNQVMNKWTCANENMQAYRQEVRKLENRFEGLELVHVLRHNNEATDELANLGSKRLQVLTDMFVEHLMKPTVENKGEPEPTPGEAEDAGDNGQPPNSNDRTVAVLTNDWRTPFIKFLTEEVLPTDKAEAERVS
ncbi:uncharacterized protein LOC107303772 [Oryza brachyantha]|uniref:uncharacterized protein LOC107303772 n=1 Tax=Oryza brachyantha TaxID=4533 RepID=UPI00077671AB|nr:uncharacterized protein LOC107303772 [Oryza brachyantha]